MCCLQKETSECRESAVGRSMSTANNDIARNDWVARCKDLYGLANDDETGNKTDTGEEHCVTEFESKFKKFQTSAPSPLSFVGGKRRLYRKLLSRNDTAEFHLRSELFLYQINIDHMWSRGAASNCFPRSNLKWDKFGGSYNWTTEVDFYKTRSVESSKVIGEVYGRLMEDEPRIFLSLFPTEVDIASGIVAEHLVPAAKKLGIIELFVCLYEYLGGRENTGGWTDLNVQDLLRCNRYSSSTLFVDLLFFVVRVFGRAVMVLKRHEATMLFNLVGIEMSSRIAAFNDILHKMPLKTRQSMEPASVNCHLIPRKPCSELDGWRNKKAKYEKSATEAVDVIDEVLQGNSNESESDPYRIPRTTYESKAVQSDGKEVNGRESHAVKSIIEGIPIDSLVNVKNGVTQKTPFCDKVRNDYQSVKSLVDSIKEDIDSRFFAWATS